AVEKPYLYSNNLYNLGDYQIIKPNLKLNKQKIKELQKRFRCQVSKDRYGYEYYHFNIEQNQSYFKILHNTHIQNLEKAKFHVKSLEELYVYIQELKKCMSKMNIRYCEIFVSAYEPEQQELFYNAGFRPRGFVPCWNYDIKKKYFDDYIVFNYFEGQIRNIDLLPQGYTLLSCVEL
ncbi:MAG: hypothetical protein ACFE8E_02815, partial [Candidatus Hodarchaeota archaeon]